jgi:AP-1 complex subunit gamma-1
VTDSDLVDLFETVLNSPYANNLIRQFVLVAAAKLSARLAEMPSASTATQQDRLAVLIANFSSSLELEIQQRAVEFGSLLTLSDIKGGVLERMPPPEIRATIMGTGAFTSLQGLCLTADP